MKVGDIVTIKECHSIPDLVGREAKIVLKMTVETADDFTMEMKYYPYMVLLTGEPLSMETPMGTLANKGPFPFREDELEPKTLPPLPKAFENM